MIAISPQTYDLTGSVAFKADPETVYPQLTRRVTRKATLDGSSTINDMGFSYSDGTVTVATRDRSVVSTLERLIKDYSTLNLSTKNGVFSGAIKSLNTASTPITFTFLIKEKVSG